MELSLTEQDKKTLIETARAAIAARLAVPAPHHPEPTDALRAACGAFVTLKKGGALRGCIGHIAASKPLFETVREVAVSAAFEDPRFPPIEKQEWSGIRIEISVLSPFEKITDTGLIRVGAHGIMIRRGYRSGLLLPQVATEQGWDRDTFLTHTCFKAGLPADAWKSPDANIEIFSAIVFGEEQ
ncbi:MAG: AmmeMemoRadiSam system protein A [Spirochaetes bacterium]|nr:AmmeMemoRadiSam system protein A [Spirochaetota bacterium]